jgi:hypothetical protein
MRGFPPHGVEKIARTVFSSDHALKYCQQRITILVQLSLFTDFGLGHRLPNNIRGKLTTNETGEGSTKTTND